MLFVVLVLSFHNAVEGINSSVIFFFHCLQESYNQNLWVIEKAYEAQWPHLQIAQVLIDLEDNFWSPGNFCSKCQMPQLQVFWLKFCATGSDIKFLPLIEALPTSWHWLLKEQFTCCKSKLLTTDGTLKNAEWFHMCRTTFWTYWKAMAVKKKHFTDKKSNCKVFSWQNDLVCETMQLYWTLYLKRTNYLKL